MIKNILVRSTGKPGDAIAHELALQAARPFKAHLKFLHVQVDPKELIIATASVEYGGSALMNETIERSRQESNADAKSAKAAFAAFCTARRIQVASVPDGKVVSAEWVREIGSSADWVSRHGMVADLVVLTRPGEGMDETAVLEAGLFNTGRPLLIAPTVPSKTSLETVVIAWEESAPAARAVDAAMPFLEKAQRVIILVIGEKSADNGVKRLVAALRWHGVEAEVQQQKPGKSGAADTMLAAATKNGAGLIVMGGYGHSPTREWVFGGFTERVLKDAELPVLMAH